MAKISNIEEIILGIIVLIAFGFTYRKIFKGSKSEFAYTLLYFTFGYSVYFIIHSFY